MSQRHRFWGWWLLASLAAAASTVGIGTTVRAQVPPPGFTIKNQNATFTLSGVPSTSTGLPASVQWTVGGQGNPNQAFQNWWYYRLPNAASNSAISAATNPTWTINQQGNEATTNFTLTPTLSAAMKFAVYGDNNSGSELLETLTIKNTGNAAVTMSLFNYLDLDLGGTPSDDAARFDDKAKDPTFFIGDKNWVASYSGTSTGFTAYAGDAFPKVRDLLTKTGKDFPNAEQFFLAGDGDWTGGLEWSRTIAPNGGTTTIVVDIKLGPRPMPEPAAFGMLAVGLAGMALFLRPRGKGRDAGGGPCDGDGGPRGSLPG